MKVKFNKKGKTSKECNERFAVLKMFKEQLGKQQDKALHICHFPFPFQGILLATYMEKNPFTQNVIQIDFNVKFHVQRSLFVCSV